MPLERLTQIAFATEAVKGSPETLAAADVVKAVGEVSIDGINPLLFDDETINATLGDLPKFAPGVASWDFPQFSIALAGHALSSGSGLTKLPYGHLIESCGFEALDGDSGTNAVEKLSIGAVTGGPFRHGEVVDAATGEQGVVIGDTFNGTTTLYVEDTAGAGFSNTTITGASSGATATISASAGYNPHAYRLISNPDTPETLTAGLNYDGKLIRAKGCRGNMTLRLDHANRAFLDFNFRGVLHDNGSGNFVTEPGLYSGVSYTDRTAPASLGLGLSLNDGSLSLSPVFNRLQLDVGNDVTLDEDTNSASGWDVARITDRSGRLTVNPREVAETSYTFINNFIAGTTARSRWTIGSTPGNTFVFIAPFLSTDQLGGATRNNNREWDGTFMTTKGSYVSSGATTFGENNEIVIIHE